MSPDRLGSMPPREEGNHPPVGPKIFGLPEESRRQAVRRCIFVCLTNGWAPPAEVVWRMVALREAFLKGARSEGPFLRLEFARHLYRTGRISG